MVLCTNTQRNNNCLDRLWGRTLTSRFSMTNISKDPFINGGFCIEFDIYLYLYSFQPNYFISNPWIKLSTKYNNSVILVETCITFLVIPHKNLSRSKYVNEFECIFQLVVIRKCVSVYCWMHCIFCVCYVQCVIFDYLSSVEGTSWKIDYCLGLFIIAIP